MINKDLQDQLSKMRRSAEERDAQKRAKISGLQYISQEQISVDLDAVGLINKRKAVEAKAVAVQIKNKDLVIVFYDPDFSKTKELLKEIEAKGYNIKKYVCSESSLNYVLSYYRFISESRSPIVGSVGIESGEGDDVEDWKDKPLDTIAGVQEEIKIHNNTGSVSDLVQIILSGAINNRASDIHIEPSENNTKIRYRVDGVLNDVFDNLTTGVYRSVISRIKLLSKLKLNVHDEPQDGRFTINLKNKDIEVRVAIAPSEFGDVAVMRILDPDAIDIDLSSLGFREDDLDIIKLELSKPNGMILNTGPTGSGKTTTLYAFLKHKNSSEIKIITIEDPIEYHLDGIEQTQVNEETGYDFASGLRSLMRQDPDVILVGEIRDKETAEISVQSALTGHLVFSTVHANSSSAAIPRLLDLGVKSASLAPALNIIIAQRLARKLCKECKKRLELSSDMKTKIEKYINSMPDKINKDKYLKEIEIFEPVGCEKCGGAGYKGRVGLFELLEITDNMKDLVTKGAGQIEIQKEVDKTNFINMEKDGVLKVVSGITDFNEVERVIGKIDWV